MRKTFVLLLATLALSCVCSAQSLGYTPRPVAANISPSAGVWQPWTSVAAFGALGYTPDPVSLYCQASNGAPWTPCNPGGVVASACTGINGALVLNTGCYAGADMGAQINTALASSACASGCTIDTSPLTGAQSSASNISINHSNTSLLLGNVTLSLGANQLLVPSGTNRVSIQGAVPWGGPYMATGTGGAVIKYTGTASPVVIGDASAQINYFSLKDVGIDISGAGTAAIGLTTNRLITGSIIHPNIMGSNISNGTQEGIQINSTGSGWSGLINIDEPTVHGVHRAIDLNGTNAVAFGVTTVTVTGGATICATSDTTSEGWYAQNGDTNQSVGYDAESCAIGFRFGAAETRFRGTLARTEADTTDVQFDASAAWNSVVNNNPSPVVVNNSTNQSNVVSFVNPKAVPLYLGNILTLTTTQSAPGGWASPANVQPYTVLGGTVELGTAANSCSTPGVFSVVVNGTPTACTVTIPNASFAFIFNCSGISAPAGQTIGFKQTTAAAGCTTTPASATIILSIQ